jgi:hypothetical protein
LIANITGWLTSDDYQWIALKKCHYGKEFASIKAIIMVIIKNAWLAETRSA